ncbi:hypothetical protein [Thauera sp.]|jgi:hypothetical protein|uniref:hypothetical protein n=1 Tax=Thauera sp. TaxID=1905334 RepID=UPI002610C8F5|nr:hypothetical protein [Thauera sp.]MCK6407627.1 hypothetical protein [Thauera sp.]
MMDATRNDETVERRRRVLKGAVGASTVLTLGYGGNVAAASLGCVNKAYLESTPPGGASQFLTTDPGTTTTDANWAWSKVEVWRCSAPTSTGATTEFDGFSLDGNSTWYAVPAAVGLEPTKVDGASKISDQSGYPRSAWVLAYFDESGNLVGRYPDISARTSQRVPLEGSCLASVNPNATTGFTFGG